MDVDSVEVTLLRRQRDVLQRQLSKFLCHPDPKKSFDQVFWRGWGIEVGPESLPEHEFIDHCVSLIPTLEGFMRELEVARMHQHSVEARLNLVRAAALINPCSAVLQAWNYNMDTMERSHARALEAKDDAAAAALQEDQRNSALQKIEERKQAKVDRSEAKAAAASAAAEGDGDEEKTQMDVESEDEEEEAVDLSEIPEALTEAQTQSMEDYKRYFNGFMASDNALFKMGTVDDLHRRGLNRLIGRLRNMKQKMGAYLADNKEKGKSGLTEHIKVKKAKSSKSAAKTKRQYKRKGDSVVGRIVRNELNDRLIHYREGTTDGFDKALWSHAGLNLIHPHSLLEHCLSLILPAQGLLTAIRSQAVLKQDVETGSPTYAAIENATRGISADAEMLRYTKQRKQSWMNEAVAKVAQLANLLVLLEDVDACYEAAKANHAAGIVSKPQKSSKSARRMAQGFAIDRNARMAINQYIYAFRKMPNVYTDADWVRWGIRLRDSTDVMSHVIDLLPLVKSLLPLLAAFKEQAPTEDSDLMPVLQAFASIQPNSQILQAYCSVKETKEDAKAAAADGDAAAAATSTSSSSSSSSSSAPPRVTITIKEGALLKLLQDLTRAAEMSGELDALIARLEVTIEKFMAAVEVAKAAKGQGGGNSNDKGDAEGGEEEMETAATSSPSAKRQKTTDK